MNFNMKDLIEDGAETTIARRARAAFNLPVMEGLLVIGCVKDVLFEGYHERSNMRLLSERQNIQYNIPWLVIEE